MAERRRLADMPVSQRAGMLCHDQQFRRYVAHCAGLHVTPAESAAAEFVRRRCRVASRRDLDTNPDARARFDRLVTDFDAWRGRIVSPER